MTRNTEWLAALVLCGMLTAAALAQDEPKPATDATKKANAAVLHELPFGDRIGIGPR